MPKLSALSRLTAGTLMLAASGFAAPAAISAQDDDDVRFGAYIYAATCDDLAPDAIIRDIDALELEDDSDDIDEYWVVLGADQDTPSELYVEDEDIDDLALEDLLAEPHAIAVHAEDNRDADVVACGDISGDPDEGFLFFDLQEVDDSGYAGRAYLQPDDDDDDDDDLDAVIGLWPAGEVQPLASPTPLSTPAT